MAAAALVLTRADRAALRALNLPASAIRALVREAPALLKRIEADSDAMQSRRQMHSAKVARAYLADLKAARQAIHAARRQLAEALWWPSLNDRESLQRHSLYSALDKLMSTYQQAAWSVRVPGRGRPGPDPWRAAVLSVLGDYWCAAGLPQEPRGAFAAAALIFDRVKLAAAGRSDARSGIAPRDCAAALKASRERQKWWAENVALMKEREAEWAKTAIRVKLKNGGVLLLGRGGTP